MNEKSTGWFIACIFVAGTASAQDSPSWRTQQDQPKRPELPPEVERPDYSFSVSREQLMGFTALPADGTADTDDPLPVAEMPEPADALAGLDFADQIDVRQTPIHEPLEAIELEDNTGLVGEEFSALEGRPESLQASVSSGHFEEPATLSHADTDTVAVGSGFRLVRSSTVQPDYPRRAYRDKLEGWVNLRVTVAPSGAVEEVEVIAADPPRIFDVSAKRAVHRWRFEPPQDSGVSEPQFGVYRISYNLDQ